VLPGAEARLAFLGEDRRDRPPGVALDLLVEVDEDRLVTPREPAPHRALAAARKPHEDEVHDGSLIVPAGPGGSEPAAPDPAAREPRPAADPGGAAPSPPGPPSALATGRRAIRSRYRARLSSTSTSESPPNFSSTAAVRVRITIASPITPAAGTTLMSEALVVSLLDRLAPSGGPPTGQRSCERRDRLDRAADDERLAVS